MRASFFFRFFFLALGLLIAGCTAPGYGASVLGTATQAATISIGGGEGQLFATTPTLGQTLLVPTTDTFLHQVTFRVDAQGTDFRTDVYAWDDNAKAITGVPLATATQTAVNGLTSYPLTVDTALAAGSKVIAIVACATCGATAYADGVTNGYGDGESYTPPDATLAGAWTVNGSIDMALGATFLTPTTTSVVSDVPKVFGQPLTLKATVVNGSGGSVAFTENGNLLQTKALGGDATASISTSTLAAGSHTITAAYSGTTGTVASSGTVTFTVDKATPTVAKPSASSAIVGQTVTLSTSVSAPYAGTPGGAVSFYEGATLLGTNTLVSGATSISYTFADLNPHAITATYAGDGSFATATSLPLTQTASRDTVAIDVKASPVSPVYGNDVVLAMTVTAQNTYSGAPTGNVHVTENGTSFGTATVDVNGNASVTITAPTGGAHTFNVHYDNDVNHAETDVGFPLTVAAVRPTTTLTAPTPKVFGETISFVATVSPPVVTVPALLPATGSVAFLDGTTTLGTVPITAASNGVATFSPTASLAVGTHSITAQYTPAAGTEKNYLASLPSAALPQAVGQATTVTDLSAASTPSIAGTSVKLTATITVKLPGRGSNPRGTVAFYDGAANLSGDIMLSNTGNTVSYDATLGPAGDHALKAVYSGSPNLLGSTGTLTQQVVQLGTTVTTVTVGSSSGPANPTSTYGSAVTFTIKVASPQNPTPTGKVTVTDTTTGAALGTPILAGGSTTVTTSTLTGGTHTISATYNGDTTYAAGASGSVVQTVNPAASGLTLAAAPNPSVFGQSVTFTATSTSTVAGTRTGKITFSDGLTTLQEVVMNGNVATYTTTSLVAGTHGISAVYSGDGNYTTSTSATLSQIVGKGSTTTSVVSSTTPSLIGTSVIFTATVAAVAPSAGIPAGNVTFKDGASSIGSGELDKDGFAVFATSTLLAGNHNITAVYLGSNNHNGSTSGIFVQRVNTQAATISLAATPKPAPPHGEPITFTATLTGRLETPTGAMLFKEGPVTLGAGPLASGISSFATKVLSAGNHTIVAAYSGDETYAVGSGAVALAVGKQTTTTVLHSSANPAAIGSAVTLSAEISSTSIGFTGQVQFLDAQTSLGFAVVTGTTASLVANGLTPGDHAITAVYGGDDNFAGSTASVLMQNFGVLASDAGADGGVGDVAAGSDSGGCGCRTTGTPAGTALPFGFVGLALAGLGLARRRRQR